MADCPNCEKMREAYRSGWYSCADVPPHEQPDICGKCLECLTAAWNRRASPQTDKRDAVVAQIVEKAKVLRAHSARLDGFDCVHDAEDRCSCGVQQRRLLDWWTQTEEELYALVDALAALKSSEPAKEKCSKGRHVPDCSSSVLSGDGFLCGETLDSKAPPSDAKEGK